MFRFVILSATIIIATAFYAPGSANPAIWCAQIRALQRPIAVLQRITHVSADCMPGVADVATKCSRAGPSLIPPILRQHHAYDCARACFSILGT